MATYGKLKQGETINEAAARTGQDPTQMEVKGGTPVADAPITTKPALTPNPRDAVKPALVPNPRDMVKPAMTPNPRDAMQQPMPTTGAPMPVSAQKQPTPTKVSEPPLKAPTQFLGDVPATPSPAPETKYGVQGASISGFGGTGETSVRDYTDIMKMFNDFRTGVRDANFQPKTQAERQAIQTFNAYQAHKNMTGGELFHAIRTGQMTPDPRNLLWTSMYEGGQPTMAQKQAYAAWQKFITTGGAKLAAERRNPFLVGPRPNTPENINEDLNKIQDEAIVDESKATVPAKPALEDAPADETKVADAVFNDVVKNTTQEQLDAAVKGLVDFSTTTTLPEPGFQKNLRALTTEFGTNALEDDVNFLKEDLRNLEVQRRERTQIQRDKTLPTGVIAGRIGEIERQESERADYLNNRLQTAQDILSSRYKVVGMLQDAYGNDYNASVKNYDTKYKQQIDLISNLSGVQKDQQTLSNQIRDDARANLTILYNHLADGTMQAGALTDAQKLEFQKLEARAGLPAGTFANVMKKEGKAEILSTIERIDDKGIKSVDFITRGEDGKLKIETQEVGYDAKGYQEALNKESLITSRENKYNIDVAKLTGKLNGEDTLAAKQLAQKQTALDSLVSSRDSLISQGTDKVNMQKISRVVDLQKLALQYDQQRFKINPLTGEWEKNPAFDGYNPWRAQADAASQELMKELGITGAEEGAGGPQLPSNAVSSGFVGDIEKSSFRPQLGKDGGIYVPIETGAKGNALPDTRFDGRKLNKSNYQCGEFVNDYFGKRVMPSKYNEKKAKIATQIPTVGAAFIMNTGNQYGHTGIVENVAKDKSWIDVVDANRNNTSTIDRRRIWKNDNGVYVDKGAKIDGFTSGITSKDYTEVLKSLTPKLPFGGSGTKGTSLDIEI